MARRAMRVITLVMRLESNFDDLLMEEIASVLARVEIELRVEIVEYFNLGFGISETPTPKSIDAKL